MPEAESPHQQDVQSTGLWAGDSPLHRPGSDAEEVVIAIGSNIGDRVCNINRALELMRSSGIQITRHACLYESAPAYVTDQPFFLNSAVSALTKLSPHALLATLKQIEGELGRTSGGIRYTPCPILSANDQVNQWFAGWISFSSY